jgi:crotonobetainyl-CoA:carnitine CoA-transferase CaiB-like acyl-CoA transferase
MVALDLAEAEGRASFRSLINGADPGVVLRRDSPVEVFRIIS